MKVGSKSSPPNIEKNQPNQGRAHLFISDLFPVFEIKDNDQKSNLCNENVIISHKEEDKKCTDTENLNINHNKPKIFSFEQLNKISIPPNQQEAQDFSKKINNPVFSISVLPDEKADLHLPEKSNNNPNFSFSNLHILFGKEDCRSISFQVSPVTSISSPFEDNIQVLESNEDEKENNDFKFHISDNSVAYRQCIDLELNYNYEFSETSSFNVDLIKMNQESIEETQNIEFYDENAMDRPNKLIFDSSFDMFEQYGNSSTTDQKEIDDDNDPTSSDIKVSVKKEIQTKSKKPINFSEEPIQFNSKQNDSDLNAKTDISTLISDPVYYSSKEKTFELDNQKVKPFGMSPIESISSFSFGEDQIKQKSEKKAVKYTDKSVNTIIPSDNELEICSLSILDFGRKAAPKFGESDFETIISIDAEQQINATLESSLNNEHESLNVTPKKNKVPRFSTSDPSTMANIRYSPQIDNLKSSGVVFTESESTMSEEIRESDVTTMASIDFIPAQKRVQESDILCFEKLDQIAIETGSKKKNKKQIPRFTTSEPSIMANIRYSPQKEANKLIQISPSNDSSSLNINESNINDSADIKESDITPIISVKFNPEQGQASSVVDKSDEVSLSGSQKAIRIDAPSFSTSELSTMANIRFSPQNTNSEISFSGIDNEENDQLDKETIIESEIEIIASNKFDQNKCQLKESSVNSSEKVVGLSNDQPKNKKKKKKQIPVFSASEPSSLANIHPATQSKKLQQSKIAAIEIKDKQNSSQNINQEEFEEDDVDVDVEEININESEPTTIASISSIPNAAHKKGSLALSKQIIVENETNQIDKKNQTQPKADQIKRKISKKEVPSFSTSEPSTMLSIQYSASKEKLQQSQVSSIGIDINDEKSDQEQKEPELEEIHDEVNINESEPTTITSINYIPYQDQKHDNSLVLSKQFIIENSASNEATKKDEPQAKPTKSNQTKRNDTKRNPSFSPSEPSTIMSIQYSSPKEKLQQSQVASIGIDINDEKSDQEQKGPEHEEIHDEANINESEPTTITSINYIPYQDQKHDNSLVLSKQFIIENGTNTEATKKDEPQAKPTKSHHAKRNDKQRIPSFSQSEPSSLASIQYSPQQKKNKLYQSQVAATETSYEEKSLESMDQDPENIEEEEEISDEININESQPTTIASVNYVPYESQKQRISLAQSTQSVIEKGNEALNVNESKAKQRKAKQKKTKEIPAFSTSEPSALSHIQHSSQKKKLHQSQASSIERNNEEPDLDKTLEVDEHEDEFGGLNISESNLTTIASINSISYHDRMQKDSLILSEQVVIENANDNENNFTSDNVKPAKSSDKSRVKNVKKIPSFSTSKPSAIATVSQSSQKKSLQQSRIECIERNDNDVVSDSSSITKSPESLDDFEEEEEEERNEISINESEMITIASINYSHDKESQKDHSLALSEQVTVENDEKETESNNERHNSLKVKKNKQPKEVPSFTTSEPSTISNLQNVKPPQVIEKEAKSLDSEPENDEDLEERKQELILIEEEEDQDEDEEDISNIKIEESEIFTIVSIKYDEKLTQEQNKEFERNVGSLPNVEDEEENEEEDSIDNEKEAQNKDNFVTPKRKEIPHFSTSDPQSTNLTKAKSNGSHSSQQIKAKHSFEPSEMNVISGSSSVSPTKELIRSEIFTADIPNDVVIQSGKISTPNNNSRFVVNESLTIDNGELSTINSIPENDVNDLPHFELSEPTTSAIRKGEEKTPLKQSNSLSLTSNQVEDNMNITEKPFERRKELSQSVAYENSSIQNDLEQSRVVASESFKSREAKRSVKTKKSSESNVQNSPTNLVDQQTETEEDNSSQQKILSMSKNEDFFINNDGNDKIPRKKKMKQTQKDVKFSPKMKSLKEHITYDRSEISVQTTNDDLPVSRLDKAGILFTSGTFCVETDDNKEKDHKKKAKSGKKTAQTQSDDSNPLLSLSDSQSCDANSDQNLPQFEQSLITTITDITMKQDNENVNKNTFHLSFQQNPPLLIKEKPVQQAKLSNSQPESYQMASQESDQINIPPQKELSSDVLRSNQTQTESINPTFENSNLTTILSLNKALDDDDDVKSVSSKLELSLSPTTFVKTEDDLENTEKVCILQNSSPVEQDFFDEDDHNHHFNNVGVETVANFTQKEEASSNSLELASNEVVFANGSSKKMELIHQKQLEITKEKDNPSFQMNDLTTIASIPVRDQNLDFTIEAQTNLNISQEEDEVRKHGLADLDDKASSEQKSLSISANYSIFENSQALHEVEPIDVKRANFELSEISRMVDISEMNSTQSDRSDFEGKSVSLKLDQKVNEFHFSSDSKQFHESLPVSIFSSNEVEQPSETNEANRNSIQHDNEYSNHLLFEQEPRKVEISNSNKEDIELEQSGLVSIVSVQKEQEKAVNLAPSHFNTIDINQNEVQKQPISKSIEETDSFQKVDQTNLFEKVEIGNSNKEDVEFEQSGLVSIASVHKEQEKSANLTQTHFDVIDINQKESQKRQINKSIEETGNYQKADQTDSLEKAEMNPSNRDSIEFEQSGLVNIVSVQKEQEKRVNLTSSHFDAININQNEAQKQPISKSIEETGNYQKADQTDSLEKAEMNPSNRDSIEFEQSGLVNIVSVQKEQEKRVNLTSSHFDAININQNEAQKQPISKSIEVIESNQKVDQSDSLEKVDYKESEPLTLISIQGKKEHKERLQTKYELASNGTIFANQEQQQLSNFNKEKVIVSSTSQDKSKESNFEISNLMSFEKSNPIRMTQVFGGLYLKPESNSPIKTRQASKAKLSVNSDSRFYFEENGSNEVPQMKTSRSLENFDSFTIKKDQRPLTMIFGSFSVNSNQTKSSQHRDLDLSIDDEREFHQASLIHSRSFDEISRQCVESQTDESLMKKKGTKMDTVFGCFEIKSPLKEKISPKDKQFRTVYDSFEIASQVTAQAVVDSSSKEKKSLSMTSAFGRFDISPGTYEAEKQYNEEGTQFASQEEKSNKKLDMDQTKSFFVEIENDKKEASKKPLSKESDYFYVNNQSQDDQQKKQISVEKEVQIISDDQTNHSLLREFYSSEVADISKPSNANLEQLSLNSINIEPNASSIQKQPQSCGFYSSEVADISKEPQSGLEHLSLNSINIEPNMNSMQKQPPNCDFYSSEVADINKEKESNLEQLSLNSINIEPSTKTQNVRPASLSIGQGLNSINVPEDDQNEVLSTSYQKVDLHESKNLYFEVPSSSHESTNFDLSLNHSQLQIQPKENETTLVSKQQPAQAQVHSNDNDPVQAQVHSNEKVLVQDKVQREIVVNELFEVPLVEDLQVTTNPTKQYDSTNNVEIKASFPLFFEFSNNQQQLQERFEMYDENEGIDQSLSITSSSPFFIPPERKSIDQIIEEEEEDTNGNQVIGNVDFNSPVFSNIDLCKKLISRQIGEIKSLEREVVKKEVALDSLNRKFELFKESTKQMLAKHFGEIRSLNETNAKLVSQIDSLQTRLSSKSDAVFSHLKQRTVTCSLTNSNEIVSIEPTKTKAETKTKTETETTNSSSAIENRKDKSDSVYLLVTVTIEDVEPLGQFAGNSDSLFYLNRNGLGRRLFISNPFSYEETSLFANSPLLRESGKITQFSLLPRSSFIPLKVDTNLFFEQKEIKPSLTFSFYHLRVTRPKLFSTLHLEDNLTVAHIVPQKISKTTESKSCQTKDEIRRNIERSQFFVSGENDIKKKNFQKFSLYVPKPLIIESVKKTAFSSYAESFDISSAHHTRLAIKKTQAISFIVQKKQK